ncbi:hypothetical protein Cantr_06381 [Candida viswanathii]|uniref:Uncharacterized protein n=1 Tax=Candida viswanathii TaxID=5486 RepID=A0A367XWY4_9ASCO|nr:hypothetical protein Cantr_06381 [Candida viswanathii]
MLAELSFTKASYFKGSIDVDLDQLKFPRTLRKLVLNERFITLNWEPPQSPRELSLLNIYFHNGFNVKLPPDLFYLHTADTNLFDLDNVQFPTGLRDLTMWHNYSMRSMLNTNLKELTQLVSFFVMENISLTEFDTPNDKLRCKSRYWNNGASN